MSDARVDVAVDVDAARLPIPSGALERLVARAVAACGLPGATSVALIDDATMRQVNRDYHDCDEPTDVLAFRLGEPDEGPGFAFEIVVSWETAAREAEERGVDVLAECLLYVVHGALHLLGYDDHDPAEARKMHARTLEVLRGLGYENRIEVDG